jgi:hypothetical protein
VVEKAAWKKGWARAKFRQFGTYQAFIDTIPPTVNAPGVATQSTCAAPPGWCLLRRII